MAERMCIVEQDGVRCDRRVHARLLCEMHYRRMTRYDRLGGPAPEREQRRFARLDPLEQLWQRSVRLPNGCREWQGGKMTEGYGEIQVAGRTMLVHRFVYEQFIGPIPPGHVVDHTCHNRDRDCPGGRCRHRLCIEVSHFEAGTIPENFDRGWRRLRP